MSEMQNLSASAMPTVYFIDDSATMREVIKIAFRKEKIHVITCPDAASALAQFSDTAPDAVITDVIMPNTDGYEVCRLIKQNEQLAATPVILMSGVVNRTVAEKAMEVKADELIRKPFQPNDLIVRVKNLLHPRSSEARAGKGLTSQLGQEAQPMMSPASAQALSGLFMEHPAPAPPVIHTRSAAEATAASNESRPPAAAQNAQMGTATKLEIQKLRNEIWQLELLVKKLQAELEAGNQYCVALEAHIKAIQQSE